MAQEDRPRFSDRLRNKGFPFFKKLREKESENLPEKTRDYESILFREERYERERTPYFEKKIAFEHLPKFESLPKIEKIKPYRIPRLPMTPFSEEPASVPTGERRFSPEQRAWLEERGYQIFSLSGATIPELRSANRDTIFAGHSSNIGRYERSIRGEIAVSTNMRVLDSTANMGLTQQRELVEGMSGVLSGDVPGLKEVIGTVADYVDLLVAIDKVDPAFAALLRSRNFRTETTATTDPHQSLVVLSRTRKEVVVFQSPSDERDDSTFVLPLIVPTGV